MARRISTVLDLGGRLIAAALAGAMLATTTPAYAAETGYPTRSITLVVPFAPGGATDYVGRALAARLGEKLGQSFIIDNRPGAGGTLGAVAVARAPADGYTLLFWQVGMVTSAHLYEKLPYHYMNSFEPIGLAGSTPTILTVNPSVPAKTIAEFIALAKSKPGEFNAGSSGVGSSDHLALELFQTTAGVKLTHVPFRGGAPAVTSALSGDVHFLALTGGTVMPHVLSGGLRALAVAADRRMAALPDVPTAAESGLPGYGVDVWFGLWAPAGTPKEIVAKINDALQSIATSDDLRATLAKVGVEPGSSTTEQFVATIRADYEKWGKVIRDANIKPQ